MDKFFIVTLFNFQPSTDELLKVEELALDQYGSLGIEEFSLSEAEVDEILGQRSYSGGDLPQEVIDEVEEKALKGSINFRFFFSDEAMAKAFHSTVSKQFLCEPQFEEQQTEDWNAEWKKHYSPIKVNDYLEIIPSWSKDYVSDAKEQIYIYPGMGFGTGSHETTFLCLKIFTENLLGKDIFTVLDFGSGSGILGLSIFKFYPNAKVDFYDIDPEANKNCYQNAETNHLENNAFRLLLPEVRSKLLPRYDVVYANILENVLVLEKDALISHLNEGGSLILSGLLKHQAKGIIDLYSQSGMKLIRQLEKGDWVALLMKKENA